MHSEAKQVEHPGGDRTGVAIGLSLVAHACMALLGVMLPTTPSIPTLGASSEVFVDFDPPAPPIPTPALESAPPEADAAQPSSTDPPSSRARSRVSSDAISDAPSIAMVAEPTGASSELPDVHPEPLDSHRREQLATLMAPNHVASSFAVQDSRGPVVTQGPAGLSATGGRPALATEAEVEARLSDGLRDEIMARPWLSATHPRLVQRPDGSQVYTGHAFTATIRPDGSVDFADRGAVDAEGMVRGEPMRFDMTDMFMRSAGQDPYRAERAWFMEETEEARAALEIADAERLRRTALARIPGQLAVIWSRSRLPAIRRRAIFAMWDDCDEEADGLRVRERVIAFIRMEIPESSADAFTTEELRRWNAERASAAEFLPYR